MTWTLVDRTTNEELRVGDTVRTFRDEAGILKGGRPPHKPGSSGHVYVHLHLAKWDAEFYPSVINARWVP